MNHGMEDRSGKRDGTVCFVSRLRRSLWRNPWEYLMGRGPQPDDHGADGDGMLIVKRSGSGRIIRVRSNLGINRELESFLNSLFES